MKIKKTVVMSSIILFGLLIVSRNLFPFIIVGNSMKPSYHSKELVLCQAKPKKITYGDVVVIKKDEKTYIKRVVALEGDTLNFNDKKLYINDSYICTGGINKIGDLPKSVPKGYVFCLGDNYNHSIDSRDKDFGFVKLEKEIIGKVVR